MFDNERFLTSGVQTEIPIIVQLIMWDMIDELKKQGFKMDYLQVFRLKAGEGTQIITHIQEQPAYENTIFVSSASLLASDQRGPVNNKIFVIDDGTHSTMLLAEEY